jgi:hypothetical protein
MLAFLVALYGALKGDLLHLVLDEADMWAPQSIKDKEGGAATLHHNVQKIVRRGRVKGFIPWLITQRPAEISKSILSMMDGMVMHQATSPQDMNACMDWVRPRADKATAEKIETQLPAFERGQAVVYIPRRKLLNIAQFPKKATFDSSRSPERGEKKNRPDVKLKPLDIEALKKRLEKVEAEAKANDPGLLKAEIAKLKAEKAQIERAKPAAPAPRDPKALTAARERAAEAATLARKTSAANGKLVNALEAAMKFIVEISAEGFFKAAGETVDQAAIEKVIKAATQEAGRLMQARFDARGKEVDELRKQAGRLIGRLKAVVENLDKDITVQVGVSHNEPFTIKPSAPAATVRQQPARTPSPLAAGDGTLTKPQLALLRALAWWRKMGHDDPRRPQVAAIAGWKPTGSNLRDRISELKRLGLVDPQDDRVRLTPEGVAAAPEPDTGATVIEGVRVVLTSPQLKLFDAMHEHGIAAVERAALAEQLGWEPGGSNLRDRLSELRRMDVVVTSGSTVQLADWMFSF